MTVPAGAHPERVPELKVAAFTGGRTISSARFRVRQYIPALTSHAVRMREFVAPFGAWPPRTRVLRPLWGVATLATRLPAIGASYRDHVTFLQREMVSTLRTLEPFTKAPRVLDLDDAVWLNRESQVRRLVQDMNGVVCGNDFIADWAAHWNKRISIIPTPVDTDRWTPLEAAPEAAVPRKPRIIGWSGLHAGAKYLVGIQSALRTVLDRYPDTVIRIVSDRRPELNELPPHRVEFIRWSPENEVRCLQEMSVGLMPLDDTPWERGKCSYKMLLCMACAVPVVVSPVGMNAQVLSQGEVGFGARSDSDWVDTLSAILDDPALAARLGSAARATVLRHYSLKALAVRLAQFLRGVAAR